MLRFQLNRSLTGMGHERYTNGDHIAGRRPADELARRLFATGQAAMVHIYSNIVSVDLVAGSSGSGLDEVIRRMYQFWTPGKKPPSFEDLQPPEDAGGDTGGADGAAASADAAGNPALAVALARIPSHLLERAKAGRERWDAKAG